MGASRLAEAASSERCQIDDIILDAGQRKLLRAGQVVPTTRLTFDLLLTLVDNAPNLVAHDEIIQRVWGPRRIVSPETLAQCVTRLRHTIGDDAASPRFIESVRGQGYRLIPEVRRLADAVGRTSTVTREVHSVPAWWSVWRSASGVAALVALIALGALGLGRFTGAPGVARGLPEIPQAPASQPRSIAVLPISTAGMDAAEARIADGLHADILNELARIGDLTVIARATMRRSAGSGKSITDIARELNVQSVLQLDLRLSDRQLDLTAELIDGRSGAQTWFSRYDGHLDKVLGLQRQITLSVAEQLDARLSDPELARLQARPTTSAEAYEFFLTAVEAYQLDFADHSMIARSSLDKAIALDPDFAVAYGFKALIYASAIDDVTGSADDLVAVHTERARMAEEYAAAAIALDPGTVVAHRARATVGMRSWRWTEAKRAFETAIEHGPNDVTSLAEFAFFSVCALREPAGLKFAERALELDPRNPRMHELYGRALNCTRDYPAALAALRRSVELDPTNFRRRGMSAYVASRVLPTAEAAQELHALEPMLTDLQLQSYPPIALTYWDLGFHEDARRLIARFEELNGHTTTNLGNSVFAYLAVGDEETAYRTLERALEHLGPGSGYLTLLAVRGNMRGNPALEQPRFARLRERIDSID